MIITISGANFSASNIGTLSTWTVSKSIGAGAEHSIPSYVDKNSAFNYTITLKDGYTFGTYSVSMGGQTITPTVTETSMTINIASVTGAIRIEVKTINSSTGEEDKPVTPDPEPEQPGTGSTVVNLFTLNDSETLDALFMDGIYRDANGLGASAQFDEAYPSSEKIYINGNEGTYTLPLESGKTYRWKCVPYFEWGNIKLDAPWGINTKPFANSNGKNFWFFDANDTLIANNKTAGSDDDCTLMTIPEGAVYMRFMTLAYEQYLDKTKVVLMNNLMVTEGTDIYEEYVAPLK